MTFFIFFILSGKICIKNYCLGHQHRRPKTIIITSFRYKNDNTCGLFRNTAAKVVKNIDSSNNSVDKNYLYHGEHVTSTMADMSKAWPYNRRASCRLFGSRDSYFFYATLVASSFKISRKEYLEDFEGFVGRDEAGRK